MHSADEKNIQAWQLRRTDPKKAFAMAGQALEISRRDDFEKGIGEALRTIGYCWWRFNNYVEALQTSIQSLEIFEKINELKGASDSLNTIGIVYVALEDFQTGISYFERSMHIRNQIGDFEGVAISLSNIGESCMKAGEYEKALQRLKECLSLAGIVPQTKTAVLSYIGHTYIRARRPEKAIPYLTDSVELAESINYERFVMEGSFLLGRAYSESQPALAETHLNRALEIAERLNEKDFLYPTHKLLASILADKGKSDEAYQHMMLYDKIREAASIENNIQKIKNIQTQNELDRLKREKEFEKLQNEEMKRAYNEIEKRNKEIAEKNLEITDSIRYAKRIQDSILPSKKQLDSLFKEYFVLYKPKDIVCGDFYWVAEVGNLTLFAAVDCTGHGVPGAFMSLIGYNLLLDAISKGITEPAKILDEMNDSLFMKINQNKDSSVQDGMDIGLCSYNRSEQEIHFAGANNSLWLVRNERLVEIKGNKFPVGSFIGNDRRFTNNSYKVQPGDNIYLFSDGYHDQFGGPGGKKLMKKNFQQLIISCAGLSLNNQCNHLNSSFEKWKGNLEQLDDVLLIGVRV